MRIHLGVTAECGLQVARNKCAACRPRGTPLRCVVDDDRRREFITPLYLRAHQAGNKVITDPFYGWGFRDANRNPR